MDTVGHLHIYQRADLDRWIVHRKGEVKLGEDLQVLKISESGSLVEILAESAASGMQYGIIGIPEDVGVRANLGRKGAGAAWEAFLPAFLNLQSNRFLEPGKILLLGEVAVQDLLKRAEEVEAKTDPIPGLRQLTAELDERICPIIESIGNAGLKPIVIGGNHNNAYPILKGVEASLLKSGRITDRGIGCVNCDAHLDFRSLEGRHSGNSFSYAHQEGILKAYDVIGLQEQYNNAEMLDRFARAGFRYWAYEDFAVRRTLTFESALGQALEHLRQMNLPIGMEIDLDSMANAPASAEIPFGLSAEQVFGLIHTFANAQIGRASCRERVCHRV